MDIESQADFDETTILIDEYYAGETAVVLQDSDGVFWTREEITATDDDGNVTGPGELTKRSAIPKRLWPNPALTTRPMMASIIQRIDGVWLVVCMSSIYVTSTFEEDDWYALRIGDTDGQYMLAYGSGGSVPGKTYRVHPATRNGNGAATYTFLERFEVGDAVELRFGAVYNSSTSYDVLCFSAKLVMQEGTDLSTIYNAKVAENGNGNSDGLDTSADFEVIDTSTGYTIRANYGTAVYTFCVKDLGVHILAYVPTWGAADGVPGYGPNQPFIQLLLIKDGIPRIAEMVIFDKTEVFVAHDLTANGHFWVDNLNLVLAPGNRLRLGVSWAKRMYEWMESNTSVLGIYEVGIDELLGGYTGHWSLTSVWDSDIGWYMYGGDELVSAVRAGATQLRTAGPGYPWGPIAYDYLPDDDNAGEVSLTRPSGGLYPITVEVEGESITKTDANAMDLAYGIHVIYTGEEDATLNVHVSIYGELFVVNVGDTSPDIAQISDPLAIDFKKPVFCVGSGVMQWRRTSHMGPYSTVHELEV